MSHVHNDTGIKLLWLIPIDEQLRLPLIHIVYLYKASHRIRFKPQRIWINLSLAYAIPSRKLTRFLTTLQIRHS